MINLSALIRPYKLSPTKIKWKDVMKWIKKNKVNNDRNMESSAVATAVNKLKRNALLEKEGEKMCIKKKLHIENQNWLDRNINEMYRC